MLPEPDDVLRRPYIALGADEVFRRVQCRVLCEDWLTFANLYPQPGATELILTTLIHGITNELRKAGLNSWSPDNQRTFVAHIRRCASLGVVKLAVPRTDTGEGETVGGVTTEPTEEPTTPECSDD